MILIHFVKVVCVMKLQIYENPNSRVKQALFGDSSGKIRTFAVLSAENPMGMKNSAAENNKNTAELKSKLTELGVQYVPIEGKYGNIEHSFMLFNIVREDAQYLAEWFEHRSHHHSPLPHRRIPDCLRHNALRPVGQGHPLLGKI